VAHYGDAAYNGYKCSKSWFIQYWIIQKLHQLYIYSADYISLSHQLAAPNTSSESSLCKSWSRETVYRVNLCMWTVQILTAKCVSGDLVFFIIYTPYCISSDEEGLESVVGKTGHYIKWQVKWLGVTLKLLGTLRYTLCVTLWYLKN
jgi:hypothetical protein